jgi:magnesium transporter
MRRYGEGPARTMNKLRYPPPGTAPATLIVPQEHQGRKPVVSLIEYDAHSIKEAKVDTIDDLLPCLDNDKVSWINVDGLGDAEFFQQLGLHFRIHQLALEDIFNLGQRPKVEEYDRQLFVVLAMAYENKEQEVVFEQVCMVLAEKFVITIQEESGDVFDPVRQRLRERGGNARFMKADYLAYALIDAVIDQYFPIIESLGDSMDELQETLLENPTRERIRQLHEFRRVIAQIRRAVWPQRDVLGRLMRDETGLVAVRTKPFFRDCYDHTVVILDLLESYREHTRDIMDLYLSSINIRIGDIVRVLTVISSIFIPLTFIAGVYGMNFDPEASPINMPELEWPLGYPFAICLMLAVAVGMIIFFRHKKWL